jgi:hypothetical protein
VADDGQRILLATMGLAGSVGSMRDATGLSTERTVAALAHLQGRGLVTREAGVGAAPDVWRPVVMVSALDPMPATPLVLDLDPEPRRVECQDYRAHATAHRWDASLDAFRCDTCHPERQDPTPAPVTEEVPRHAPAPA